MYQKKMKLLIVKYFNLIKFTLIFEQKKTQIINFKTQLTFLKIIFNSKYIDTIYSKLFIKQKSIIYRTYFKTIKKHT